MARPKTSRTKRRSKARRPENPLILRECVNERVAEFQREGVKGRRVRTARAFGRCTKELQGRGLLKKGSRTLTHRGTGYESAAERRKSGDLPPKKKATATTRPNGRRKTSTQKGLFDPQREMVLRPQETPYTFTTFDYSQHRRPDVTLADAGNRVKRRLDQGRHPQTWHLDQNRHLLYERVRRAIAEEGLEYFSANLVLPDGREVFENQTAIQAEAVRLKQAEKARKRMRSNSSRATTKSRRRAR